MPDQKHKKHNDGTLLKVNEDSVPRNSQPLTIATNGSPAL
jgi:hypothetical protein